MSTPTTAKTISVEINGTKRHVRLTLGALSAAGIARLAELDNITFDALAKLLSAGLQGAPAISPQDMLDQADVFSVIGYFQDLGRKFEAAGDKSDPQ